MNTPPHIGLRRHRDPAVQLQLDGRLHTAVIFWDQTGNRGIREAYRKGANIDALHYNSLNDSWDGNLHLAVRHSPKAIKMLLRLGVDTALLDSNKATASEVASSLGMKKYSRTIDRWDGSLRQRIVHLLHPLHRPVRYLNAN